MTSLAIDLNLPPVARYLQACGLYGITLRVVEGQLRVRGPLAAIEEIREDIHRLKPELIEYLTMPANPERQETDLSQADN